MFVSGTPSPEAPQLYIVTDYRLKSDADMDFAQGVDKRKAAACYVLHFYKLAARALGSAYSQAVRVALFEYGSEPTASQRATAQAELQALVAQAVPGSVFCIVPTGNVDEEGADQRASSVCWAAMRHCDSLLNMRGCFCPVGYDCYALPLWPHSPMLKQLQYWQQGEWLKRALSVVRKEQKILTLAHKHSHISPGHEMLQCLQRWAALGSSLAVDIESIETTGQITAIGLSDGRDACSIPFDAYAAYGRAEQVPGLASYSHGPAIQAALASLLRTPIIKAFHNHTFDVPRLKARGLPVSEPIHDTFTAHAVAYPELRHGLQHATANLLPIVPWKSAWHPRLPGIGRQDIEFWTCDPIGLQRYNAEDAFYTWHLASKVLPHVSTPFPRTQPGCTLHATAATYTEGATAREG